MQDIGFFADLTGKGQTPIRTDTARVNVTGSSVDQIYAEAIKASQPTLVVDKYNLLQHQDVPGDLDRAIFPVLSNFDLTFYDYGASGNAYYLGSTIPTTAGPAISYKTLTPIYRSAAIFIHDMVGFEVNKNAFQLYTDLAATSKQKRVDQDALASAIFACDDTTGSKAYAAGGFAAGSITAASTLTPTDLEDAKNLLVTGSDLYPPDVVVMHPNQYNQLKQHQDFSPSATSGALRKAVWQDGELVKYAGMDVVVTELVNAGTAGWYAVAGHPVAIFRRGVTGALVTKEAAFNVTTERKPLSHGEYKIFDVAYGAGILVIASCVILRTAD